MISMFLQVGDTVTIGLTCLRRGLNPIIPIVCCDSKLFSLWYSGAIHILVMLAVALKNGHLKWAVKFLLYICMQ